MDHVWAVEQLREFIAAIDGYAEFTSTHHQEGWDSADELITLDPIMRELANAARSGFGDYPSLDDASVLHTDPLYWGYTVKPWILRAIGVHSLGAEAHDRMRPDSPDLLADQFHPWAWEAATPLWEAGNTQEAVHAAARSVNARLQQKLGRRDSSEAALCREAFSRNNPTPTQPRLRFPGDRDSDTWKSRQQGGVDFGAGCFEGIRNPAAHEEQLNLPDQAALEQLAAFSLLARWIDECSVETATTTQAS